MRIVEAAVAALLVSGMAGAAAAQDGEPDQESGGQLDYDSDDDSGGSASAGAAGDAASGDTQTQVLRQGVLRIEGAPIDFAMLNSGYLGEGRGLNFGRWNYGGFGSDAYAGLALGASYGVIENLEVGLLLLPIRMAPNGDFGNMELHGRYGVFSAGMLELAVQANLQLPTNQLFGFGLGAPVRLNVLPGKLVVDTGIELELMARTGGPGNAQNLDIPVAVNYFLTEAIFVGGKTGLIVLDFSDVKIPLGVQGGYTMKDGMIELKGWFEWPGVGPGEYADPSKVVDGGTFELGLGANIFLDVP